MSVMERTGDRGAAPEVQARLAQLDLFQGRPEAAVARLESLLDEFELDQGQLLVLAESYVEAGN